MFVRRAPLLLLVVVMGLGLLPAGAAERTKRRTIRDEPQRGYIFRDGLTIRKGDPLPAGKLLPGNVWELEGLTLDGRDSGDCCDKEGGAKITVRWPGLTIRNGRFANWPDGVGINAAGITFENCAFENCEDCLNTGKGARDWTLRRCFFRAAPLKRSRQNGYPGDKAIQANVTTGRNVIDGCTFVGFRNAIRGGSQKHRKSAGILVCRANRFVSVANAVHVVAGQVYVDPKADRYEGVPEPWREESPGRLYLAPLP